MKNSYDGADYDRFEEDLMFELGPLFDDPKSCQEIWGGLTNIKWNHPKYGTVAYTFRSAGDLIAEIRQGGNYMDWYCNGPSGEVPEYMLKALGELGWEP